jgi:biopolymer transport protein ExbD
MSHQKKQKKKPHQQDVELPITPMLDMTFQLMAFFIATYHPAPTEGQIAMALPLDKQTSKSATPTEQNEDLDVKSSVLVIVRSESGGISGLAMRRDQTNEPINYDSLKDLEDALKKVAQQEGKGKEVVDTTLKISADNRLKYVHLVEVMDACLRAGFTKLGFEANEAQAANRP